MYSADFRRLAFIKLQTTRSIRKNIDLYVAMDCAAAYGHLDVVQWLHANRTEGCTTGTFGVWVGARLVCCLGTWEEDGSVVSKRVWTAKDDVVLGWWRPQRA